MKWSADVALAELLSVEIVLASTVSSESLVDARQHLENAFGRLGKAPERHFVLLARIVRGRLYSRAGLTFLAHEEWSSVLFHATRSGYRLIELRTRLELGLHYLASGRQGLAKRELERVQQLRDETNYQRCNAEIAALIRDLA